MKKYLISLIFIFLLSKNVQAEVFTTSEDIVKQSGIEYNLVEDLANIKQNSLGSNILIFTNKEKYNSLSVNNLYRFDNIFIICNSEYEEKELFSCSNSTFKINSDKNTYKEVTLKNNSVNNKVSLYLIKHNFTNIIIINEDILTTSENQKILVTYLKELNIALNHQRIFSDSNDIKEDTFLKFFNSISFETLKYSAFIILLILLFQDLLIYFQKNINRLDKLDLLREIPYLIIGDFKRNFFLKSLIIFLLTIYFTALIVFIKYFDINDSISLIKSSLNNSFSLEILPLFYFIVLNITLFFILKYKYINKFLLSLTKTFCEGNVKKEKMLFLFIFFSFSLFTLLIFNQNNLLIELVLLNILILFLITLYSKYRKYNFFEKININYRILVISISSILITTSCILMFFPLNNKQKFENLINQSTELVMLPYYKTIKKDTLSKNFSLPFSSKVLVNEYLVYSPNSQFNINKNIDNFESSSKNFSIVSNDLNSLFLKLLKNNNIIKSLNISKTPNFFHLDNKIYNNFNNLNIVLNVKCNLLRSSIFTMNYYYLKDEDKIGKEIFLSGDLISCNSSTKEYSFSVPKKSTEQEIIIYFSDNLIKSVESIYLKNSISNEKIDIKGFNVYKKPYYIIDNSLEEGNAINYCVNNCIDTSIKNNIQISDSINYLLKSNKINNNFLIWSEEDFVIIKNKF